MWEDEDMKEPDGEWPEETHILPRGIFWALVIEVVLVVLGTLVIEVVLVVLGMLAWVRW